LLHNAPQPAACYSSLSPSPPSNPPSHQMHTWFCSAFCPLPDSPYPSPAVLQPLSSLDTAAANINRRLPHSPPFLEASQQLPFAMCLFSLSISYTFILCLQIARTRQVTFLLLWFSCFFRGIQICISWSVINVSTSKRNFKKASTYWESAPKVTWGTSCDRRNFGRWASEAASYQNGRLAER